MQSFYEEVMGMRQMVDEVSFISDDEQGRCRAVVAFAPEGYAMEFDHFREHPVSTP